LAPKYTPLVLQQEPANRKVLHQTIDTNIVLISSANAGIAAPHLQDNVNPLPIIHPVPCNITKDNNIPIRSSGILVNCKSAVNNIYHLDLLIQKHASDLVLLTETWFDANVSNTYINQPEFQVFWKDRVGKRGGGVAILIQNDIPACEIEVNPPGPIRSDVC